MTKMTIYKLQDLIVDFSIKEYADYSSWVKVWAENNLNAISGLKRMGKDEYYLDPDWSFFYWNSYIYFRTEEDLLMIKLKHL